jgi:hypothetical protein
MKKYVGTIKQTTLMKNTKLIHGMKKYIVLFTKRKVLLYMKLPIQKAETRWKRYL